MFYASTSSFLLYKPVVFWSDPAISFDLLSFQETPSSTASTFRFKDILNSRIKWLSLKQRLALVAIAVGLEVWTLFILS